MPNGSINGYAGKRLKQLDDEEGATLAQKLKALQEAQDKYKPAAPAPAPGAPVIEDPDQKRKREIAERLRNRDKVRNSAQ